MQRFLPSMLRTTLLVAAGLFVSLPVSLPALSQSFDFPVRGVGLSIGDSRDHKGLRLNFRDRRLRSVQGVNATIWTPYNPMRGDVQGLALGLPATGAANIHGLGIGILGVGAEESITGVMLAGLGGGAGESVRGIGIAGLGMGSGRDLSGIMVAGLGAGAGRDVTGILVAGLGAGAGGDVTGIVVAGIGGGAGGDFLGVSLSGVGSGSGGALT
ncbi:MAG: hypothetical protein ACI84D_002442, partial [Thalassolituus oleivorans]